MGGTSQSHVLLCSPRHLPGARIKPGCALASGRFLEAAPLLPVLLAQPPMPRSGKDPGPQDSLGGLRAVGWELPLAGCLLPECCAPPHPVPTAGSFHSLSSAQKRASPLSPPPEFSPELKTLSCTQIPEGSGTQLMLNPGLPQVGSFCRCSFGSTVGTGSCLLEHRGKKGMCRNSLAVQWLGLQALTAQGLGSIRVWGPKISQAKLCDLTNKFKKCVDSSCSVYLISQLVKNSPAMQETRVRSLGWEDPLEKGKATHVSILAWRILWTV